MATWKREFKLPWADAQVRDKAEARAATDAAAQAEEREEEEAARREAEVWSAWWLRRFPPTPESKKGSP